MPAAGLTLSLDYRKIELETFTQNGTGGAVPEGQFGFDRTVNTGGITVPSALPGGSVDPSPQPATYFMLIDGLNGGSTDTQHKGWFEITGFDLDLEHVRLPASGEANFSPLNVTLGTEVRLAEVMDSRCHRRAGQRRAHRGSSRAARRRPRSSISPSPT